MAERDITRGKWVDIENEDQFNDCIKYGCIYHRRTKGRTQTRT